jgi:hypothetical protein
MNLKKLFLTDLNRINLKSLKTQSWVILILVLFNFFSFIATCVREYYFGDKVISIEVNNQSDTNTYKKFTVGNNTYVTGNEGILYYKTTSFSDVLLFKQIGNQTIVDYFFFLIIGFIVFISIRRVTDKKVFSEKIINTLGYIGLLLFAFPIVNSYFRSFIVEKLLLKRTNNMFELAGISTLSANYLVAVFMILLFLYFLKRGDQLQQDQELTI